MIYCLFCLRIAASLLLFSSYPWVPVLNPAAGCSGLTDDWPRSGSRRCGGILSGPANRRACRCRMPAATVAVSVTVPIMMDYHTAVTITISIMVNHYRVVA